MKKTNHLVLDRGFRLLNDYSLDPDYLKQGWREHRVDRSGTFSSEITACYNGLNITAATRAEAMSSGIFSFNHFGLNLKPVKNRVGIAVDVDVNSINVVSCPDGNAPNLARFVTGAVFFRNGAPKKDDLQGRWYNSVFVATGIGMMEGESKSFTGLWSFAVILHCKDTCLVLEEYSPPETEPAEVLLLQPIAPVKLKERATIGVEFVPREKKIVFYHNHDFYEFDLVTEMQFTKYHPFFKMDIANFISPCDSSKAVSAMDVTVRNVYLKTEKDVDEIPSR